MTAVNDSESNSFVRLSIGVDVGVGGAWWAWLSDTFQGLEPLKKP